MGDDEFKMEFDKLVENQQKALEKYKSDPKKGTKAVVSTLQESNDMLSTVVGRVLKEALSQKGDQKQIEILTDQLKQKDTEIQDATNTIEVLNTQLDEMREFSKMHTNKAEKIQMENIQLKSLSTRNLFRQASTTSQSEHRSEYARFFFSFFFFLQI